jgi:deoxyhypusine synthase
MGKHDKKSKKSDKAAKAPKPSKAERAAKAAAVEPVGDREAVRGEGLRKDFEGTREVTLGGITGHESPEEVLRTRFPAFVGRQERTAFELMARAVEEDYATFMTLSGAMTPAGLHQSCLIPLIERGLIDCLTTTGANLYHDAHRIIGHRIREIDPNAGDLALRLARIIRIYDLGFWEETLLETDMLFSAILRQPEFQKRMTTTELHYLLGKAIAEIEDALGVKQPSLLATCYRRAVPIFVGAVQDGSIFLNIVKLKRLFPVEFKLEIDVNDDVYEMGAMQHFCLRGLDRKMAVFILGGGVPKNYTLQGEPLLDQILNVPTDGFDIDVQFCVDPVDNGALSSCPAGEGHTWGKVSPEGVGRSVYVHADVTAVFPWITYALLSDSKRKRPHRRLYDHRADALTMLDQAVAGRREELIKTVDFPLVKQSQGAVALASPKAPAKAPKAPARPRAKKGA